MRSLLKLFLILLALIISTVVFFSFTNPDRLPVGWLMIPILLVFGLFGLTSYIVLRLLFPRAKDKKKLKSLAILSGVSGSLVLLFQSTGGVVLADILLMGLLLVITYLYISRY